MRKWQESRIITFICLCSATDVEYGAVIGHTVEMNESEY